MRLLWGGSGISRISGAKPANHLENSMSTPYREPQGEPAKQVRVRIAGVSHDNYSSEHNRHIKFLEITLEAPSTLPVNLEAQLKELSPPSIKIT